MLNALVQQSLILTGTNLTTEQQFVLFFNASMEQSNYILNDRENILKNLKNVFGKYELNYLKRIQINIIKFLKWKNENNVRINKKENNNRKKTSKLHEKYKFIKIR